MKLLAAFLSTILFVPILSATDFSGIWLHSAKAADGHTDQAVLALQQSGDQLTGKFERAWGNMKIEKGLVEGNKLSFTARSWDNYVISGEGVLEGDKLHITVHEPDGKSNELVAQRVKVDPLSVATVIAPPAVKDLSLIHI